MAARRAFPFASLPRLPRKEWLLDAQSFLHAPATIDLVVGYVNPRLVIEIGSWKGHSAIRIAQGLRRRSARVLCVDTWLGSIEHWLHPALRRELHLVRGFPTLYRRFLSNVAAARMTGTISALPMTSDAAAILVAKHRLRADLIYVDAAHDEASVSRDLGAFIPLLTKRGVIFGDDADWPGVEEVARRRAREHRLTYTRLGRYWVAARDSRDARGLFVRYALLAAPDS